MTKDKQIDNSKMRHVCCPICGRNLFQGEYARKIIIRCHKCLNRIKVDIINGKTTTEVYELNTNIEERG